ncbi:MAG: hypothetical protein KDI32_08435 [Pseudomonadales bacterium]|nr:hypothetical protein [Pseudomonadales bacterium]
MPKLTKQRKALLEGPVLEREPTFLDALPNDNLVGAIVALTSEVYILRERLQTLEAELEARKVLPAAAVEHHDSSAAERDARSADLAGFTERIFSELSRDRTPVSTIDPRVMNLMKTHHELNTKK